jgi:hypothetical protein
MEVFFIDQTILSGLMTATEAMQATRNLESQDMATIASQMTAFQSAFTAQLLGLNKTGADDKDRLLDVEEAAKILGVNPFWIYKRTNELPFVLRVGQRKLRISEKGLRNYIREQLENGGGYGA